MRADPARAKREGLTLDLDRVAAAGPAALTPDDHYRLKTYGVCAQRHTDLFMLRMRVPGGRLSPRQVSAVSEAARRFGGGWLHLTTRQNVELHSIRLQDVPAIRDLLEPVGLFGRSACGHTVRNVMACPESATSAEVPFDVQPDAEHLSRVLVAESEHLNVRLPSRVNIVFGGCSECSTDALVNDIGLVPTVREGLPGYQVWVGGSLGSAPRLAFMLRPFLPREQVPAAVWAIIRWYMDEGDLDRPSKGRLKFVIEEKGEARFRRYFQKLFEQALESRRILSEDPAAASSGLGSWREATSPPPPELFADPLPSVEVLEPPALDKVLARAPSLGWRPGITPERRPGLATITVRIPLGDLLADELEKIAELSPDGSLVITRDQNLLIRSVPTDEVARVCGELGRLGLGPDGARGAVDVRSCPGLAFCSIAITASQPVALQIEKCLSSRLDLPKDFTVAVSGCPNSCARHQAADIGLAGGKVRVGGRVGLGYQLMLGADLAKGVVGEPVLRVLEEEAPSAVVAAVETWVALRRTGERPGETFRRVGLDVVASAIAMRLRGDPESLGSDASEAGRGGDTGLDSPSARGNERAA
ncbi:MAG: ferredoxin--nitrite reductase [Acidimicrobiales bacterium]|nr:MAG: ferredoxin--nitrite reductase [Acidimicrobiales bacterium]